MKKLIISCLSAAALITACSEENLRTPYGANDGRAPGEVSEVVVDNRPGGAIIKYNPPADNDLQYVKGVYLNSKGVECEVRASGYVDSLVIEGFGDTKQYPVKLIAVDKFENESNGVTVVLNPGTPPVEQVFNSLRYIVDFGGFVVNFLNESQTDVAIYVERKDTIGGEMEYYDAFYTKTREGSFSVRGLPPVENDFRIYVRDRFDNYSEPLEFTDTPYREDELDKSLWQRVTLAGDVSFDEYNGRLENAWDGEVNEHKYAHSAYPLEFPHRFTVDFGVGVKLSRMHMWQRSRWEHGSWKKFNVYGKLETPGDETTADPLKGWILLDNFESVKPSGLPLYQNSAEDLEKYALGEEFTFPREDVPVVRYIRIEVEMSWSGMECSTMSEISFWGEIQDNE